MQHEPDTRSQKVRCGKMMTSLTSQPCHTIKNTSDIILPQEAKPQEIPLAFLPEENKDNVL